MSFSFFSIAVSLRFFPSILPEGLSSTLAGRVLMASCFTTPVSQPERSHACSHFRVSVSIAFFQLINSLPVIAQEDMRQATVEIGFGKVGIQSDCLVVIRQCRTVIFQQRQYIAAVIITVNKIGRQLINSNSRYD